MSSAIAIDVNGRTTLLAREQVTRLRDLAALDAARSSARRDLSLLLVRALETGRPLVLMRGEARALEELLEEHGLGSEFEDVRALLEEAR